MECKNQLTGIYLFFLSLFYLSELKALLRAYQMLHGLGSKRLPYTKDGAFPTVYLIPVLPDDSSTMTIVAYNQHLDDGPTKDASFTLRIKGISTTSPAYQQVIDANNANPKMKWQELGSPNYPSSVQVFLLNLLQ